MADYDPTNQGDAWDEEDGYGVADDGSDPSTNTQHSSEDQDHLSHDPAVHATGDVPSDGGASDVGDYDPETVASAAAPTLPVAEPAAAPRHSPKPTAKKPKTAGGFIVDSDSEDEDAPTPGSNSLAPPKPSNAPSARTKSPLQHVTGLSDADAPTQDQSRRTHSAAPNSGSDQTLPGSLPANARQNPLQDRVASLEDRVREDPRGAMDAWLALIREYRDHSKVNDARKTYDRFLAVFPQAVSTRFPLFSYTTRTGC
jgi:cleavage stimulation factor subunit 3